MNRPLKIKIIILNFLVSVVLAALMGVFFYFVYYNNVVEEAKNYQKQNMASVKENIEDIQDNILNLSSSLMYSPAFQLQISPGRDQLPKAEIADATTYVNFLTNSILNNNYVSFFSIYASNGYQFYYATNGLTDPVSFTLMAKNKPYAQMVHMLGQPEWIAVPDDGGSFLTNNSTAKLTMMRSLIDIDNWQSQGIMMVCIDWNSIWSSIPEVEGYGNFIVDSSGSVVTRSTDIAALDTYGEGKQFSVKNLNASSGKSIVVIDGKKYLLSSSLIYQSGLYVVCLRPMSVILKNLNQFNFVMAIIVGVSMILSLLLETLISSFVTTPLHKLVYAIKQAGKGDLKQKVNFVYQDEIGVLGTEFNKMVDELNILFNKVMRLEIKNREAELKSLQAQINPHFLYNTLDSIYLKALRANDKDVADMVYALSRIFRLTLNLGNTVTTVQNEKEFIENYILLQKIRFKDRLEFKLSIDDQILPLEMPKLILQPFIENSIVHAAEKQAGVTQISVSGFYCDGYIYFAVTDNGEGIEHDLLQKLTGEADGKRGYAIRNIKERLELCYGGDYRLDITSGPDVGTSVSICIPERLMKKDDD
jgi:two-component system sensor histidine kinase YesM